jgi:hypothetical protein
MTFQNHAKKNIERLCLIIARMIFDAITFAMHGSANGKMKCGRTNGNTASRINEGSIMRRKAFLNSFIRRINIKDSEAEIEYTCPIKFGGNRRNEVLSMAQIGSRGRARAWKPFIYKGFYTTFLANQ